jgi:DnaJ-class molecular chaperone
MALPTKKSRRQAVLLLGACLAVTQPPQPANATSGWPHQQQQQPHLQDQPTTATRFNKKPAFVTSIRGGSNRSDESATQDQHPKHPHHPKPNPKKKKKESSAGSTNKGPSKQKASSSSSIVEDILKESDYYKILGIDKQHATSVDANAIKKAYRRRALLTHPDKTGGDRRAFDKVAEAYEILSDDHKRHLYDRYGKDGVNRAQSSQQPQQPFMNAEDLFRSFFGGGNPFSGSSSSSSSSSTSSTNRTMRFQLEVSLEDMYFGRSVTVQINPHHQKTVTVDIPRGAHAHQHIRVHGAMDHDDQSSPGDLDFILTQRPHPMYTRKGYDLAISIPISLSESLCGFQRKIRHIDGRKIHIVSSGSPSGTNHLLTNGDWQVLKGYGMPKDTLGTEFGDLYVQLQVTASPSSSKSHRLSDAERAELQRLLRKMEGKSETTSVWPFEDTSHRMESVDDHDNTSVKKRLERANPHDFGRASGRQPYAEEEEVNEDNDGHPFFGRQQHFFWSSSGHPQSNPFFGDFAPPSEDAETQCRQM